MSRQHYGDWVYIVDEDDFSGERVEMAASYGDDVNLYVGCLLYGEITLAFVMHNGIFHNGEIDIRWVDGPKDGEIESYRMEHRKNDLRMNTLGRYRNDTLGIISSLRSHSELRLRFRRWKDEIVTDRISLNGFTDAINNLPCVNP